MDHRAHVGPVDAHAERDGGDDHDRLAGPEAQQPGPLLDRRQAGMERDRRPIALTQRAGDALGLVAAAAVDDRGGVAITPQRFQQLVQLRCLGSCRDMQVGTVERGHQQLGVRHRQRVDDVGAGARVGGGGEGDPRHAGQALRQLRQQAVFGPELVTPGRHAVRLVDGDHRDGKARQPVQHVAQQQPLGRHVEKVEAAVLEVTADARGLVRLQFRMQGGRPHAELAQRRHLIVHQRDQGRDHQPHAGPAQGRELVADALAAAGRHQQQGVVARHHAVDRPPLQAAEARKPEHPRQHRVRIVPARGDRGPGTIPEAGRGVGAGQHGA